MTTQRRQNGFSLVELLIVVAIIGIVSAIAVPNLISSRRAANEASAQSSLRVVFSAQATYQATKGTGAYAGDLATLGDEHMIDGVLAAEDKSGYHFDIVGQAGSGNTAEFGIYAFPLVSSGPLQTGTRTFGTTEEGILRGEADLSAVPNTLALIRALPVLEN